MEGKVTDIIGSPQLFYFIVAVLFLDVSRIAGMKFYLYPNDFKMQDSEHCHWHEFKEDNEAE
ncbi:hypothetical protein QTO01_13960 [Vibrio mytili]|uniref:hypothetical protein n=1 Tax=Vibrio mytili TaxID=50718 RepID=UPI002F3FDBCE